MHNIQCELNKDKKAYDFLKRQWYACIAKSKPDLSDVWLDWRYDCKPFIEAMLCLGWSPGHTVERIVNNSPLEPDNVHFVPYDSKIRTRRRANTKYINAFGVFAPLAWFIESHPLCTVRDYHVVYGRIASGWDAERALTASTKARQKPHHCMYSPSTCVQYDGQFIKISQIKTQYGLKTKDIVKRLNLGWSISQAVETPIHGERPSRLTDFSQLESCADFATLT